MTWVEQAQSGVFTLKNIYTGEILPPERIVSLSGSNLTIVCGEGGLTLVPLSSLQLVSSDSVSDIPVVSGEYTGFIETTKVTADSKTTVQRYMHLLGLDSPRIEHCKLALTSGIVSDSFRIPPYSVVMIEATCNAPGQSAIELSIIDGIKEHPILPDGVTKVAYEKIYPGLPLRFRQDTDQTSQMYLDGTTSTTTIANAIASKEEGYSVSYVPLAGWNVTPSQTLIQLKIVLHASSDEDWPQISSIVVKSKEIS